MNKSVYIVCGVPGSGKTWVCKQLTEKFTYIPHDDYPSSAKRLVDVLVSSLRLGRPVITECPFGERELVMQLLARNVRAEAYFIVEPLETVRDRYLARSGKPLPQASVTRCKTIINRAIEWQRPYGNSETILKMLQELEISQ